MIWLASVAVFAGGFTCGAFLVALLITEEIKDEMRRRLK